MRELRLLLSVQAKNSFRFNEIRHTADKKQRRRLIMMLALYALLALMGIGYAALMMWGLYAGGMIRLLPAVSVLLCAALSLMTAMIRTQALFFSPQGYDQLSALPLPGFSVPLSKLLGLYASALGLSLMIILPSAVFYALAAGFRPLQPLVWLFVWLLAPMPALTAGLTLAALPAILLQRLKHRSLLSALVTLPLVTWMLLKLYTLPMDQTDGMALLGAIGSGIENTLAGFYPPAAWAGGVLRTEGASIMRFFAFSLLPFLAAGWALICLYHPIQAAVSRVRLRRGSLRPARVKSPLLALTLKEGRRIASSPLYLLNTGIGMWMVPMALILLPLVRPGIIDIALSLPMAQALISRYLPPAVCFFSAMALPATVSVSMEGKSAWLMCTAPVSSAVVLGSKALFSILFCLPPILITAFLLLLHLKLSFTLFLLCLLLPLALCSLASMIGLMLDLRFARFDWENEQQIIKNSAQTGLGVLASFIMLALLFTCFHFAPQGRETAVGFALTAAMALAAALLMRKLSKRKVYQIQ